MHTGLHVDIAMKQLLLPMVSYERGETNEISEKFSLLIVFLFTYFYWKLKQIFPFNNKLSKLQWSEAPMGSLKAYILNLVGVLVSLAYFLLSVEWIVTSCDGYTQPTDRKSVV